MTRHGRLHTAVVLGANEFTMIGPQLDSPERVIMKCSYRGDNGPPRFFFRDTRIEATAQNVRDHEDRGYTTIGNGDVRIRHVEHVLSALLGMDCLATDIVLALDKETSRTTLTPPVAYLNTEDFVLALRRSFHTPRPGTPVVIPRVVVVKEKQPQDPKDPSYAIFSPLDHLAITTQINFPYFWGRQVFSSPVTPKSYEEEFAWARSFFATPYPHKQEWKQLRARYPALVNTIREHYKSVMLDFTPKEWITPLREEDEPVRHKALDFLGDLALLGVPLRGGIFVYKPHHRFNRECVFALTRQVLGKRVGKVA